MGAFTVMDQHSRVVVEHDESGTGKTLIIRDNSDNVVRVPLTSVLMRELGYHCALWYSQQTGKNAFLPEGFVQPVAKSPMRLASGSGHQPNPGVGLPPTPPPSTGSAATPPRRLPPRIRIRSLP